MMNDAWLIAAVVGFVFLLVLSATTLVRLIGLARERDTAARDAAELRGRLESIGRGVADHERDVRQDLAIARNEAAGAGTALRQEVGEVMARHAETNAQLHSAASHSQATELKAFGERLSQLTQTSEARLDALRRTLEERLDLLRADNAQKLEQMRATVDEKLQATLEQRLGASFKQVSERLEQVHKGLGEMQTLAAGVGDLKRVLTNVKSRGTWGEVQLGALLATVLPPGQYAKNVATRAGLQGSGSSSRSSFPGRSDDGDAVLAADRRQVPARGLAAPAGRARARRRRRGRARAGARWSGSCKVQARTIRDKYVEPPHTTDFAILFVPTEGLYAEVLRRPGLVEALQREFRVTLAGPTTLLALLNSFQMGFRTLAIEKRSSEVWRVLGAVKTEFGKFGDVLAKTKDKLDQVGQDARRSGPEEHDDRAQVARRRSACPRTRPTGC